MEVIHPKCAGLDVHQKTVMMMYCRGSEMWSSPKAGVTIRPY